MIKKLHVGGLSERTTDSVLRQRFEAFGIVQSAQVIRDHDTGRSKGFGFVEIASEEEARDAIAGLNGKTIDGRMLTVKEAQIEIHAGPAVRPDQTLDAALPCTVLEHDGMLAVLFLNTMN